MNLYNQLHGENPQASELLAMIGLSRRDFGRYRDVYLNADGSRITVWTRIGGANRPYFQHVLEAVKNSPYALRDYDDDYDSTYAYIEFEVMPFHQARASEMATGKEPESLHDKFERSNAEMANKPKEELLKDPRHGPIFAWLDEQLAKGNLVMRFYDDDMPKELQF